MGAHLSQGGSVIDPMLHALGIDHTTDLLLRQDLAVVIALATGSVTIICLVLMRRKGGRLVDMVKERAEGSRWPEPGKRP